MTTAAEIAGLLHFQGETLHDATGRHLDEIAESFGGWRTSRAGSAGSTYRWSFGDGSALVVRGAAWDFQFVPAPDPECFCFEGPGVHTEDCPVGQREAALFPSGSTPKIRKTAAELAFGRGGAQRDVWLYAQYQEIDTAEADLRSGKLLEKVPLLSLSAKRRSPIEKAVLQGYAVGIEAGREREQRQLAEWLEREVIPALGGERAEGAATVRSALLAGLNGGNREQGSWHDDPDEREPGARNAE